MVENSERRDELLDKIVDALLENGVSDLSLRPLAERVGSSARLLIYHFGTKENMLKSALGAVRGRTERSLRTLAARDQPASLKASLLLFWDWAIQEANQRYFRLLFEVDGLSMHEKRSFSMDLKDEESLVWSRMIDHATRHLPRNKTVASGSATLIIAALSGLLQDFFTTGDHVRTMAGLQYLIRTVDNERRAVADQSRKKPKSSGRLAGSRPS